ncbi:hypothetical protein [Rhizobium sp. X9]|uniref:hypothetical protein n=1 Tax=Rhizobium sp. X9 TaxID=2815360 RepID=UPI001C0B3A80|nr:hypothetical protein [Rhizobium sp. X9]
MTTIPPEFVVEQDRELIRQDLKLHQRPFHVALAWMKHQKIVGQIFDESIWGPLMAIYRQLYPSGDFSMPALFEGGVAMRDRMYKVRVNVGFGEFAINPVECIEIPRQELELLFRLEPEQAWRAFHSVGDLIDFAYGVDDLQHGNAEGYELLSNARSSIAATARTLQGDLDLDAAVQSACLSAELAMKGALSVIGWEEPRYRRLSHRLPDAAEALITERPRASDDLLRVACARFPDYVGTRYRSHGMTRHQLMMLAMRAQFVAADAVRRVTQRDLGAQLEADPTIGRRPAI